MAYKFQLGAATLSGSLVQEGAAEVDALVADSLNVQNGGITNAGSIAGATSIDGSGDLTMGTITMSGFAVDADGDTALKSLAVDDSSTIGCDSDADIMTLAAQSLALANDVDFNVAKAGGLQLAGAAVTSTAAELNLLDDAVANTVVNSRAVIYGSAGQVNIGSLLMGSDTAIDSNGNFFGNDASFVAITGSGELYLSGSTMRIDSVADVSFDAADSILVHDATDDRMKKISFSNYASAIDGDGLLASSGVLAVQVDGSGIELNSNALRLKDDGVTLAKMAGIARGSIIVGDSAGDPSLLAKGTAAQFLQSDGTDPSYVSISGDATIAAGGALTIAAGAVEGSMLNDNVISGQGALGGASLAQADLFMVDDGPGTVKSVTFSNLEDSIFGNVSGDATVAAGGVLTIAADAVHSTMLNDDVISSQTELASGLALTDELMVSDGGTIKRMDISLLAEAIDGAGLSNNSGLLDVDAAQTGISSIYNSGLKIGYGASHATIDFGTDNSIIMDIDNSVALTITSSGVIIAGNLTVQGTTTTVDSTTINVSSSFTFEGVADDYETTLNIVDPSADRTLSLANVDGYIQPFAAASTTAITATPAEINLLDAGAGSSVALADGDGILMFDASDSDVVKKVLMSDIETYVNSTNVQNVDDGGTFQVGFNYFSSLGGAESATLPASPSIGNVVQVKAASNCSTTNKITINRAGSQTIDGSNTSIILESPDAAVSLMYVASDSWKVF